MFSMHTSHDGANSADDDASHTANHRGPVSPRRHWATGLQGPNLRHEDQRQHVIQYGSSAARTATHPPEAAATTKRGDKRGANDNTSSNTAAVLPARPCTHPPSNHGQGRLHVACLHEQPSTEPEGGGGDGSTDSKGRFPPSTKHVVHRQEGKEDGPHQASNSGEEGPQRRGSNALKLNRHCGGGGTGGGGTRWATQLQRLVEGKGMVDVLELSTTMQYSPSRPRSSRADA
jgi:hypothetical protein